ncbi:hypothetical protein BAE44_0002162 [Dichanthelium oligosanthes]|uniref:Uncharacterized protein n=1 Tax=Dichanthelium oligosanthes TaxID=888268 RepID=A0A1E5WHE2_9POAL|nr:hypothetical protein BAE44_0002162 [Dichanthelium oligosanthes]
MDGRKDQNSDLNSSAKSEQEELKMPIIKEELLLSKRQAQPRRPLSLSNWQKKKLQKLSAQKLKENNLARVSKVSIQSQEKDNI